MKKTGFLLMMIMLISPAFGQDYYENRDINTLFGDHNVSNGGYGSISINYGQIGTNQYGELKDAIIFGARGSWVIGHWFALGVGGNAFVNDFHEEEVHGITQNVNLSGGYGGLILEPIILPKLPVHLSFPVLIGAGGVAYVSSLYPQSWEDPSLFAEDTSPFLVIEPGVELEFNIVRFFRLSIGGYYRMTSELQLLNTEVDALQGWSYGVTLKFGKF